MFVGRKSELTQLEEAYASGKFEMAVVYGRRRVGKTSLINRFVADKPNVYYFTAQETVAQENLELLSEALAGARNEVRLAGATPAPVYRTFEEAFEAAFALGREERAVLVIDEYPYLAKSYHGVSSILQTLIDRNKGESRLFLILCGSSMSFMENQVLGEKSPLYGRRTLQVRLQPFDAFDAALMLGCGDPVRAVELYALAGGVPLYLEQLDASLTTERNMAERLLRPGAFLYGEPQSFLLQELASPAGYNAVIGAIASGCARQQEIADRTGLSSSLVAQHLNRLEELRVVERVSPVPKGKKRVRCRISDNLFRFSYAFTRRYATALESGLAERVAQRIAKDELSAYVGHVFEDVCRQWLVRQMRDGAMDVIPLAVGSWWGTDPQERREEEIDVVVEGADGELVLGECKWNREPVDSSVPGVLKRRSALVSGGSDVQLMLFSKSGFDEELVRRAGQEGNVRLVDVWEMFEGPGGESGRK